MVIEELTDDECRAILARTHLARLACALNHQPYIVPVHVDFHDSYLYGFATLGRKIEWMRKNPLVCLEVDELTTDHQWTTVVVTGRYEELPDSSQYDYERSIAQHLFQRHPVWWEPALVPIAGQRLRSLVLFRILIVETTGRRGGPDRPEEPILLGDAPNAERSRGLPRVLRRVLRRR
jgi:nitroimidazol reductase NimA-like FMN-containing flavoprotein (pyridoxamine 5'-phosphate oxidase superfamily)